MLSGIITVIKIYLRLHALIDNFPSSLDLRNLHFYILNSPFSPKNKIKRETLHTKILFLKRNISIYVNTGKIYNDLIDHS